MKFFLYPRIQVLKCLPVRHEAETYLSCVCLGGGGCGAEAWRRLGRLGVLISGS